MASSPFSQVPLAPKDPILGITEQYQADPRPDKVNLGVGVYYDEAGKLPLLKAVRLAEEALAARQVPYGYLPIDGIGQYNKSVQSMLFGADSPLIAEGRMLTVQSLGGTGALRIGADLLKRFLGDKPVYISDPSWENHRALFEAAGFAVHQYRYYDPASRGVDFPGMLQSLKDAPQGSIVVLHACCHNPTGVDISASQWDEVLDVMVQRGQLPFMDIAYQGFGDGIDADALAVRKFAASPLPVLVASSFSKSFSLYGERVGGLSMALPSQDEAQRVLSQLKRVVRTSYSNPPTHGGAVVSSILANPEWRTLWENELAGMRDRIKRMRNELAKRLAAAGVKQDFGFITRQRGMFSYTGLTTEQVNRLREEHGVYAIGTGRICVAALNEKNIGKVAEGIAAVLR